MRLLNCRTMKLEEFFHKKPWTPQQRYGKAPHPADYIPRYYILSHCWEEDEISYKDFVEGRRQDSVGYTKILHYCKYASERHQVWRHSGPAQYRKALPIPQDCYVWADTICIDRTSSAELSEAINSMWEYYRNAIECHVYLADVHPPGECESARPPAGPCCADLAEAAYPHPSNGLADSRWFTRGWTLQELLAPEVVTFLYSDWTTMGHKCTGKTCPFSETGLDSPDLIDVLQRITSIERACLKGSEATIRKASIAKRMSWASKRCTTRTEDEAYCLLGIFGVNMPLLYGEGLQAFKRLQETIMSRSTDHSVFVHAGRGLLATRASDFESSANIYRQEMTGGVWPFTMTNLGVEFRMHAQRGFLRQQSLSILCRKYKTMHVVLNAFDKPPGQKSLAAQHRINMLFWTQNTESPEVYHKVGQYTADQFSNDQGELGFEQDGKRELTTFYVSSVFNETRVLEWRLGDPDPRSKRLTLMGGLFQDVSIPGDLRLARYWSNPKPQSR